MSNMTVLDIVFCFSVDACRNGPLKSRQLVEHFTLCCRIHPPEHFKEKYEVDEVHFVEEVRCGQFKLYIILEEKV